MQIKFKRCGTFGINGNTGLHLKSLDPEHPGYISVDGYGAHLLGVTDIQMFTLVMGHELFIDVSLNELSDTIE